MINTKVDASHRRILVIDEDPTTHERLCALLSPPCEHHHDDALRSVLLGDRCGDAGDAIRFDVACVVQHDEGLEKVVRARKSGQPFAVVFVGAAGSANESVFASTEVLLREDPDLYVVLYLPDSVLSWDQITRRIGRSHRLILLTKPFQAAEICQLVFALTEKWNLFERMRRKTDELQQLVARHTAEMRERDQQLRHKRCLEAVGSLAGGVAQEFNDLLQVIHGYVQFAIDELPEESRVRSDLLEAHKAVAQAAEITAKLLSFSNRRSLSQCHADLNEIVSQAASILRPLLGRDVDFVTRLLPETAPVYVDRSLLEEVLACLCINASDAMPAGGTLTVSTDLAEASDLPEPDLATSDQFVRLSVADTGSGMSEEVRRQAFEPFFTTKDTGRGSGLGLAMVRSVIQEHGGQVQLQSWPGCGTTVTIFLPLETLPTSADEDMEARGPAETVSNTE